MNNSININSDFTNDEIITIKNLLAYIKPFFDNNTETSGGGANPAIEKLIIMSKDGTLQSFIEIITFIVAMKNSMSTDIIVKMTQLLPEPALISKLERTIEVTKETKEELAKTTPRIGMWGLLSALKDPDIQYLLNYLLVISKKLSKIARDN